MKQFPLPLQPGTSQAEGPPIEEWRPHPPLRTRIVRAAAAPALAAATVFVAVVVIAIAVVLFQPHSVPADEDPELSAQHLIETPGALSQGDTGEPNGVGESGFDAPADARVVVHVVGEVVEPGVVELEAGSRVSAAIEAAGGASDTAVLSGVNLARVLLDGEQILVPDAAQAAALALGSAGGSALPNPVAAPGGGLVNLNTADATTLDTLPKIGPALAQRIIEWRESNGGFSSVDQLLDVSGIGERTLEGFRDRVTV